MGVRVLRERERERIVWRTNERRRECGWLQAMSGGRVIAVCTRSLSLLSGKDEAELGLMKFEPMLLFCAFQKIDPKES